MCLRRILHCLLVILLIALSGYFRASGLFRGLRDGVIFHPDSPKQVMALHNYLSGNYVQYYDSLFYDGYPYGLNRLDEGLLRPWRTTDAAFRRLVHLEPVSLAADRAQLYYQGRVLRVLYGLLVVGLLYASARILWGKWCGLVCASLYGLAPLGATVTHSVTGDIGVDLFVAILLLIGAIFVRSGNRSWLLLAGAACGMAFASKYQGLLSLWILLVLAGASIWHQKQLVFSRMRRSLLLGLCGIISGVVLLNPAFLVDPSRTWRFMRRNFEFIKNYNVPETFLALPLHEKVWVGLRTNFLPMIGHIGVGLFVIGLLGVVFVLLRLWQERKERGLLDESRLREALFVFSAGTFALGSLWVATALKPVVQPFHFSFLLPPLAIVAGWCLYRLCCTQGRMMLRLAGWGILGIVLAELLIGSVREDFFWRRSENARFAMRYAEVVAGDSGFGTENLAESGLSNVFFTEPAVKPVFRNRPSAMRAPVRWWQSNQTLPYPPIPYPGNSDWIFMQGSDYPRSTRMFEVQADETSDRTLVFTNIPKRIRIGLWTGHVPARYAIESTGKGQSFGGLLHPHSQTVLEFEDIHPDFVFADKYASLASCGISFRFESELGSFWAVILGDDNDLSRFYHYGPAGRAHDAGEQILETQSMSPSFSDAEVADALEAVLYYHGDERISVTDEFQSLHNSASLVLAGGAYVLRLQIHNPSDDDAELFLRMRHELVPLYSHETTLLVPAGYSEMSWTFEKAFHPFDVVLSARTAVQDVEILGWDVKPDPAAMTQYAPVHASDTWEHGKEAKLSFPGIGILRDISIKSGDAFLQYAVRFDLNPDIRSTHFENAVLFLHVKDEHGAMVSAWDIPIAAASLHDERVLWHKAPDALPPGRYFLDGGIYHIRNRRRFRFQASGGTEANVDRRYARLAMFEVP